MAKRIRTAHAVGGSVELDDDLLGLELLTLLGRLEREGVLVLPALDLREPVGPGSALDLGNERLQTGDDVAKDGDGGLDDLVDVLGHNLEVDDSTGTGERGSSSGRGEG